MKKTTCLCSARHQYWISVSNLEILLSTSHSTSICTSPFPMPSFYRCLLSVQATTVLLTSERPLNLLYLVPLSNIQCYQTLKSSFKPDIFITYLLPPPSGSHHLLTSQFLLQILTDFLLCGFSPLVKSIFYYKSFPIVSFLWFPCVFKD